MCLTNFLVKLHNLLGMDNAKQESTRRGPAQAFMNNEQFLREEASKLAVKERDEEQHWIAKLQGTSLSSGSSPALDLLLVFLLPVLCLHYPFAWLIPTWIPAFYQVLSHGKLPLRMTGLLLRPRQYHLPHRRRRIKALLQVPS